MSPRKKATATNVADAAAGMGTRIRDLMTAAGYTQQGLEEAIGASKGYLSRIISGKRGQKISPEYLSTLAAVLRTTPNYLRWGGEVDSASVLTPPAGLSPKLEDLPGYREAEFAVIRRMPQVPFSVFESARQARFIPPPERVDEDYLAGLVSFLSSTSRGIDQTETVRTNLLLPATRSKSVRSDR